MPTYDFMEDLMATSKFVASTTNTETHVRLAQSLMNRWARAAPHTPSQQQVSDLMQAVSMGPFQPEAKAPLETHLTTMMEKSLAASRPVFIPPPIYICIYGYKNLSYVSPLARLSNSYVLCLAAGET